MITRKPYRSPFWTPEPANYTRTEPGMRHADFDRFGPEKVSSRSPLNSLDSDPSGKYSAGDIEQFRRLISFNEKPSSAIEPRRDETRPSERASPSMRQEFLARTSAQGASSGKFRGSDIALFNELEAVLSSTPQAPAESRSAATSLPHDIQTGYTREDDEIFERLMKLDR